MISILMPAYIDSVEKLEWLNQAIESVRGQLFDRWELILMDDASPMTINLQTPDERVRQFRMVHRSGPAMCRNTAARLATNETLLPLDSDDMLPDPSTLGYMFSFWERTPNEIIFGNIQRLEKGPDGNWTKGKIHDLPEYTFQKSLDMNGIMPVTAMHSYECHMKAGGWKPELEAGLEDVEYWIAAGKAGYCGRHVDEVTLVYRKHSESRSTQLRLVNKRETEMRNYIRELHHDVYEGKFPMGCCGGGKPYVPPAAFTQNAVSPPVSLDQYGSNEKVWVEYAGQREASFGMVGKFTNLPYTIDGPGHKIEVHINDLPMFRRSGRGLDFLVGVAAPNGHAPTPKPQQPEQAPEYVAPEPQVAQIERFDSKVMA